MRPTTPVIRSGISGALVLAAAIVLARAQEPGVSAAAVRFTLSTVDDGIGFHPSNLVVEDRDWVRWKSTALSLCHTTTSGSCVSSLCSGSANICSTSGPWDCVLSAGAQFTRQFPAGSGMPYFCRPHCGLGMKGAVTVTTPIVLSAANSGGSVALTWSGTSGFFTVFRSGSPTFCIVKPGYPACTVTSAQDLTPSGITATSFTDSAASVGPGMVLYYLVMNKSF